MSLDTVKVASESPNTVQPYKELGLKEDEYQRIKNILGRRPTSSELAMYSVMCQSIALINLPRFT